MANVLRFGTRETQTLRRPPLAERPPVGGWRGLKYLHEVVTHHCDGPKAGVGGDRLKAQLGLFE